MALPTTLQDREFKKFDLTAENETAVRVLAQILSGSLNSVPSGLSVGGLITEVTLNTSTWVALPTSPLTNRNAISIQNRSGSAILINYTGTGDVGVTIPDQFERHYRITDGIVLYARAVTGSPTIVVEELA